MKAFEHEVTYVADIINLAIKEELAGTINICKVGRLWVVGHSTNGLDFFELVINNGMISIREQISKFAVVEQTVELKYGEKQYLG